MQQKQELGCDIYRASKPETKGDKTSANGDQTVDDTLFEEPMLPRRSNEEIENCSEMAKLSPKVDIESLKQQNNEEENRYDHEGKK